MSAGDPLPICRPRPGLLSALDRVGPKVEPLEASRAMRGLPRALPVLALAAAAISATAAVALATSPAMPPEKVRLGELVIRLKGLKEERARLEKELAERSAASTPTVVADLAGVLEERRIRLPLASETRVFGGPGGTFDLLVLFDPGPLCAVAVRGGGGPVDVPRERLGDRLVLEAARRPGRVGEARKIVDAPVLLCGHGSARFEHFQLILERGAGSGFWAFGLATWSHEGKLGFLPLDLPNETRIAPAGHGLDEVRVNLALVKGRTVARIGERDLRDESELEATIEQARGTYGGTSPRGLPVLIDARPDVPYWGFVDALNACLRAGAKDIAIAASGIRREEGGR